jgi:hypothetical protein
MAKKAETTKLPRCEQCGGPIMPSCGQPCSDAWDMGYIHNSCHKCCDSFDVCPLKTAVRRELKHHGIEVEK